eukprot:CAMPEP_0167741182 /NCGR_PEP_ID=MMETSP0110_2-20121227/715_1 /TAXON_ID=629695 /ORGANISM="Gymnochlora sp., Strain CCMP2014" /LENGTH=255 /DNA_ID=CAMNT_0007625207 /DNA_START=41 /DNA_END=808 /DNA_ORIENTATION=-
MINDPNYVKYKGPIDALTRIPREQGFLSLWRGNIANCVRIVPTYSIRFILFDHFQKLCGKGYGKSKSLPLHRQMLAGALSGATTMVFTYPLDILRTRLSTDVTKEGIYDGMLDVARKIYRYEGFPGFYKGVGISIIEIAPYTGIAMGGYEYLRKYVGNDPIRKLGAGWISGLLASLLCYPLDTVKRQLMLDGALGMRSRYGGSIFACLRGLYAQSGLYGFYGGCLVNALKSSPTAALTFVLNDYLRAIVGYQRKF